MVRMCKYPACQRLASKTWALVPLCQEHHRLIHDEAQQYYNQKISKDERGYYQQIQRYTPWG